MKEKLTPNPIPVAFGVLGSIAQGPSKASSGATVNDQVTDNESKADAVSAAFHMGRVAIG